MKTKKWEDWENHELEILKTLFQNGLSISTISKILQKNEDNVRFQSKKLNLEKIKKMSLNEMIDLKDFQSESNLSKRIVGNISELDVKSKLLSEGFDVYEPILDNQICDLVCSKENNFFKIQVKSAYFIKDRNCFNVYVKRENPEKKTKLNYKSNDFDFLICKCQGLNVFYVLPFDYIEKKSNINLFPNRFKKYQVNPTEKFREAFEIIK